MRSTLQNALFAAVVLAAAQCVTRGQGSFQDLDFESAVLVPIPGASYPTVQFAAAFPGWTGLVGGEQQTGALYNNVFGGTSAICIIDNGWPAGIPGMGVGGVISGNYTAILQAGLIITVTTNYPANTALSQTGLVPAAAQSLLFKAYDPNASLSPIIPLVVTLGSQRLSYTALGSGANYTLYGANLPALAGQTAELDFTVESGGGVDNSVFLDSIQFSDQAIPEPGVFGLAGLGALLLGWRMLRRRR
jgi:hypothetical protein